MRLTRRWLSGWGLVLCGWGGHVVAGPCAVRVVLSICSGLIVTQSHAMESLLSHAMASCSVWSSCVFSQLRCVLVSSAPDLLAVNASVSWPSQAAGVCDVMLCCPGVRIQTMRSSRCSFSSTAWSMHQGWRMSSVSARDHHLQQR